MDCRWRPLTAREGWWSPFRKPVASLLGARVDFDRLADEPATDFASLLVHRDAGPGRILSATAVQVGRSESTLRRLANRWNWTERLQNFDLAVLQKVAVAGASSAVDRHKDQLLSFRDAQHRRADLLAATAETLLELVVESVRAHMATATLLQPGQLGASLTAAARALEASGSTAATALGVEELLDYLASKDGQN